MQSYDYNYTEILEPAKNTHHNANINIHHHASVNNVVEAPIQNLSLF